MNIAALPFDLAAGRFDPEPFLNHNQGSQIVPLTARRSRVSYH